MRNSSGRFFIFMEKVYCWSAWLDNPSFDTAARAADMGFYGPTGVSELTHNPSQKHLSPTSVRR